MEEDEWENAILIRIKYLEAQKKSIMILDEKVWSQGYTTDMDRLAFVETLMILDKEIERLKSDLLLDKFLRGLI